MSFRHYLGVLIGVHICYKFRSSLAHEAGA